MAGVRLDHVSKVYADGRRGVCAVEDLSLEVSDGGFVVLLGPSGCGKTTVLRLIAGLDRVSSGTISIDGREVNEVSPRDRDVAMVFQHYALYPHLSVRGNLAFGLKMRGTAKPAIARRVEEVAERLRISHLLERKPHTLSGGEQQRVAFGRAIVRRPRVYLFDEPLASLDVHLRAEIRLEMKRLHRELGMTTLYVTHDQSEALAMGERLAVLRGGRLEQFGPPAEVYGRPANRFVAGFVGWPPMNLIEGRLMGGPDGKWFEGCGGRLAVTDALATPGRCGESVVLGVRPDRVKLEESDRGDGASLAVRVTGVEPTGERDDVRVVLPEGQALLARAVAGCPFAVEERLWARLDLADCCWFEAGPDGSNLATRFDAAASHAA